MILFAIGIVMRCQRVPYVSVDGRARSAISNPAKCLQIPFFLCFLCTLLVCLTPGFTQKVDADDPWVRHVIDNHSRGSDGTRIADANGDGLPDLVSGWEQGGVVRICIHPGVEAVREPWLSINVGAAKDVEDAVMFDLDGDGVLDVVSCCEGRTQGVFVHWGPKGNLFDESAWQTVAVPDSLQRFRWMFAALMDVNQDGQVDIVAGGKGPGAELGWWEVPADPRDVKRWKWHSLVDVGWLMSLEVTDMNADGLSDLLFTDRKGESSGAYWLENPGSGQSENSDAWSGHGIGALQQEAMFLCLGDVNSDRYEDVVVAIKPDRLLLLERQDITGLNWSESVLEISSDYGTAKAPAVGDFDGDGMTEIVFSTENARAPKMGLGRFVPRSGPSGRIWHLKELSGVDGVKHDLVVPIDLDRDGDLDVLTCEEVTNLGVVWYENPSINAAGLADSVID